MNLRAAVLGSLLGLWGTGCQGDLATCDVAERQCQEDVYYSVLELRGDGYDPFGGLPPIRVISEEEFRLELMNEDAKRKPSAGERAWEIGFELLHLIPPSKPSRPEADGGISTDGGGQAASDAGNTQSKIDEQVTHVYAYYNVEEKTVTIVSHPQAGRNAKQTAMISLAHEFVHALQARLIDLRAHGETVDEELAMQTLVEGDARFYEMLFADRLMNLKLDALDATGKELTYYVDHFSDLGSPLFAAQMLIYPLGSQYLAWAWYKSGNAGIRHAYEKAPRHTVGFLIDPTGTLPRGGYTTTFTFDPTVPCLKVVGRDYFGALVFYTFLRGWGVGHRMAFDAAQGWKDDRINLYQSRDQQITGVLWQIALSDPLPAEVVNRLTRTNELSLTAKGDQITIIASTASPSTAWTQDTNCP